jgi:Bax protein
LRHLKWPLYIGLAGIFLVGIGLYLISTSMGGKTAVTGLRVLYQPISKPDDIHVPIGATVSPVVYTKVVSLADLPIPEKKEKFFNMLLPTVLISKHKLNLQIKQTRKLLDHRDLTEDEQDTLDYLMKKYRADDGDDLLLRMQGHPISIVLAQAALETGWGSSRFFRQANNVFGVWSFSESEPRIKAHQGRNGNAVYVKKYISLVESVDDYFLTLARGPYKDFRQARNAGGDPLEMIRHLTKYSELQGEYINRLRNLMRRNNLTRYDDFVINPTYLRDS